jgi:hypothetical protein
MKSSLMAWIESLPPWYFVAGDNAYVCTEHLLTPFMGCSHLNPENDSSNFLLSQLRIRVEMAFGRLATKWRILCSSLEVPLAKSGFVLQACCILYNYCIDEEISETDAPRMEVTYQTNDTILGYVPSDISSVPASGSISHQKLVQKISSSSLSRSELNKKCRSFEDA